MEALKRDRRQPLPVMGEYLAAVQIASQDLQRNPSDALAVRDYNFAIARLFESLREGRLNPWSHPLSVPGPGGEFILTCKPYTLPQQNPALYDFIPADQFVLKGTYITQHSTRPGIGAPLVAMSREPLKDAKQLFTTSRIYYGVTAIARFEGRRCVIEFADPMAKESIDISGRSYPLAADFTASIALMLDRENPKKLELARLLRPEKYAQTAKIARLQPYDPNKTVVLVTHGLMDSPATWTPMLNTLYADKGIRSHYQFWFYSYPSGYPYPYSAALMRRQLDAIERKYPLRKKMVLIGHSMGGMISRLMITDSGDKLWLNIFGKPPGQTKLSPQARELLTDALIFRHRSEVGRVIFISAPHRGSNLATGWPGRLGSSLVHAPSTLSRIGREMLGVVRTDTGVLRLNRVPNSIDTLAPNNRFVKAINTIPITPGIPYHSIMGDRGRGDTPNSSDGVVPYWSSHLDGAQSELIVPSHHSAHQNPKAIAEVRRILLKYETD